MIEDLNKTVWATLSPSKVHGIGVFAIRDIPKGQKIYYMQPRKWLTVTDWEGLHPAILKIIEQRWPLALRGGEFWSPNADTHLPSFINHSSTPNFCKRGYFALKDIKEGEELFEDYRPELSTEGFL